MNRRDFLKGIIAIAATSPLASTLYPLFKKELFTPTKDTFISYSDSVNVKLDPTYIQFDLSVPSNILGLESTHIDFYVQDPDGFIQFIGSGEPGFKIPNIPVPNYPFRLLAKPCCKDLSIKDKVPIKLEPSGYEINDDGKTLLRVFHKPIQIISRTIRT